MTKKDIHVRLDFEEALTSKERILSSQMSLLKTLKKIDNYKKTREKEIAKKKKLKSSLSELKKSMKELKKNLPSLPKSKLPKIKKKEEKEDLGVENELQKIKQRLKQLR
jgi:hypothetical protein